SGVIAAYRFRAPIGINSSAGGFLRFYSSLCWFVPGLNSSQRSPHLASATAGTRGWCGPDRAMARFIDRTTAGPGRAVEVRQSATLCTYLPHMLGMEHGLSTCIGH